MESFVGTSNYKPPEFREKKPYTYEAETWSLGIITYKLLCGEFPFHEEYLLLEKNNDVEECKRVFGIYEIPNNLSAETIDFLISCLAHNPGYRIRFTSLIKHPFISGDKITPFNYEEFENENPGKIQDGEESYYLNCKACYVPIFVDIDRECVSSLTEAITNQMTLKATSGNFAKIVKKPEEGFVFI